MDKASTYELQKVDCNCNDCKFLQRNIARYNTIVAVDFNYQYQFFRNKKARRIVSARAKIKKNVTNGLEALRDALALSFTYFPQTVGVNYGLCNKFNNDISFLPNTFQLETQNCFIHRKD